MRRKKIDKYGIIHYKDPQHLKGKKAGCSPCLIRQIDSLYYLVSLSGDKLSGAVGYQSFDDAVKRVSELTLWYIDPQKPPNYDRYIEWKKRNKKKTDKGI